MCICVCVWVCVCARAFVCVCVQGLGRAAVRDLLLGPPGTDCQLTLRRPAGTAQVHERARARARACERESERERARERASGLICVHI
jgi:hypothetical protein